jgi:hypothetical protein
LRYLKKEKDDPSNNDDKHWEKIQHFPSTPILPLNNNITTIETNYSRKQQHQQRNHQTLIGLSNTCFLIERWRGIRILNGISLTSCWLAKQQQHRREGKDENE